FVKESVLPFVKFPGEDPVLGPEMKSTGEVMGISDTFGNAFAKAQISAGSPLPLSGTVFLSVNDFDKRNLVPIARGLAGLGVPLITPLSGAAAAVKGIDSLRRDGLEVRTLQEIHAARPSGSGSRPVASRPGSLSSASPSAPSGGPPTSSGGRPTSSAGPPAS